MKDDEKTGGRTVWDPNSFPLRIKGKGEERADELIRRIESSRLPELIQEYLTAAEEVRKNKKLSPEAKLTKLLPPLTEVQKIIFQNYSKYHKFLEDRYIELKKELDLENLHLDPEKYSVLEDTELEELGRLNTHNRNIWLSEEYEWYLAYCRDVQPISEGEFKGKCETGELNITEPEVVKKASKWDSIGERIAPPSGRSISEIWPDWLPILNQRSIQSKDLLTQILVCYTIKRALGGDEEAIDRLYDCYKHAAEGLAVKVAKRLHFSLRSLWIGEIKRDSKRLLRLLIGGFRPADILSELLRDNSDRAIDAIPKWVKKYYLYYLLEWVPQKLTEIRKKAGLVRTGEAMGLIKDRWKVDLDLGLEIQVLLNPYTPIHEGTFWQKSPVTRHKFNKYSYKPDGMGPYRNLTVWLFGSKGKPLWGKLNQLLMNNYLPMAKRRWAVHKEPLVDDSGEEKLPGDFKEFEEHNVYQKPRREIPFSHFWNPPDEKQNSRRHQDKPSISRQEIKGKANWLRESGVSKRDIRIFMTWQFSGVPQGKLAEKYRLSRMQINRICKEAKRILAAP